MNQRKKVKTSSYSFQVNKNKPKIKNKFNHIAVIKKLTSVNSPKNNNDEKVFKKILFHGKKIQSKNIKILNKNSNNIKHVDSPKDYNNFRKSKTTDKVIEKNENNLLLGFKNNVSHKTINKVIVKQNSNPNNIQLYSKSPPYDTYTYNQAMKYFTYKSKNKTIQVEDLSIYFKPILTILKMKNNQQEIHEQNDNSPTFKNSVFNNNISYSQRNSKSVKNANNIKMNKNNANNFNFVNIYDKNNMNSKNISEFETQNSFNNNINNENKNKNAKSQTLYQFRPRKMYLPKTGINLSLMQFKNKILQNILSKRRKNNKI